MSATNEARIVALELAVVELGYAVQLAHWGKDFRNQQDLEPLLNLVRQHVEVAPQPGQPAAVCEHRECFTPQQVYRGVVLALWGRRREKGSVNATAERVLRYVRKYAARARSGERNVHTTNLELDVEGALQSLTRGGVIPGDGSSIGDYRKVLRHVRDFMRSGSGQNTEAPGE